LPLTGVYDLLPIHTAIWYPGELTVHVGEPIEPKGMTPRQTDELNGLLRAAIERLLEQERALAGDSVQRDVLPAND